NLLPAPRTRAILRRMTTADPALRLSYFDFHGGRGEPIRLALIASGLAFEDHRLAFKEWGEFKPTTPLGQLPVLDIDDERLTQTTAILRYVGRRGGLYPEDLWQAALCDQAIATVDALEGEMLHSFMAKGE